MPAGIIGHDPVWHPRARGRGCSRMVGCMTMVAQSRLFQSGSLVVPWNLLV